MAEESSDQASGGTAAKATKSTKKSVATSDLPRKTLEECLVVARPIHEIYAGGSASWDELAVAMDAGPKSAQTKYLIWGAQTYDLIRKDGDRYQLSETGRKLIAPIYEEEKREAAIKAVMIPTILSKFYTEYDGKFLPEGQFFDNVLETRYGLPRDRIEEAKGLILANAQFAEILTETNGKRLIRADIGAPIGDLSRTKTALASADAKNPDGLSKPALAAQVIDDNLNEVLNAEDVCFYITPIGEDDSVERRHADMMLRHLVEPVFKTFNIPVLRADKIGRAGLISQQIFEQIVTARFCVADLSFGNPNAFYELGVRHMTKLPAIQIIRKGDRIPFDVAQGRTIVVDVSDIYTLMDRMESARKELAEHIQSYLSPQDPARADDNPISIYLPGLQVKIPKP